MTTDYRRNRRTYRVSTTGSIALTVLGFAILVTQGTVTQRVWTLAAVLAGLGIVYGVTRIVQEPWEAGILSYLYAAGTATIGLLEFTNESIVIGLTVVAGAAGVLVVAAAIERWNSYIGAVIGANLGATVTGLVLYVL